MAWAVLARRAWVAMLAGAGLVAVGLGSEPVAPWREAVGGVGLSVLAGAFWAAFVAGLNAERAVRTAPRP